MKHKKQKKQTYTIKYTNENINSLYINYINTLVKVESLQNKLEKLCLKLLAKGQEITKVITKLNNKLNKLFLYIMTLQNLITYINAENISNVS